MQPGDDDLMFLVRSAPESLAVDESRMSARGLLATTARDRQGDVLEVGGVDTYYHRLNPIVLIDHGAHHPLPIGVTRDRDSGAYTVEVNAHAGEIWQTTFFSQKSQVAEQIFALVAEGVLRANSIGFRPIEYEELPPDPEAGLYPKNARDPRSRPYMHVLRSELLEPSWATLPVNPEACRKALLSARWAGRPLAEEIRRPLLPHLPERQYWPTAMDAAKTGEVLTPPAAIASATTTMQKALDKTDTTPAPTPEGDMAEKEKTEKPLYGAKCLKSMHKSLCRAFHGCNKAMDSLEAEPVKKHMDKCMKAMDGMLGDTEELHKSIYAEHGHEPLDREKVFKAMGGDDKDSEEGEGVEEVEETKSEGADDKDAGDEGEKEIGEKEEAASEGDKGDGDESEEKKSEEMSSNDESTGGALRGEEDEWKKKEKALKAKAAEEAEMERRHKAYLALREENDRNERRMAALGVL